MKKLFYLLPVAALAMASCTNDDAPVMQAGNEVAQQIGDQLIMRPILQGASTRVAAAYDNQTLDKFHIDIQGAFKEGIDGTLLENPLHAELTKANQWRLTYQEGATAEGDPYYYYWFDKTTKATFSAFAPSDWSNGKSYTASVNRDEQIDPIVAYNEGVKVDFKNGVPLTFRHATSRIQVMANNKDAGTIDINIKAMRLVNVKSTSTFNLPTVSTATGTFAWAKGDNEGNGRVWPWTTDLTDETLYTAYTVPTVPYDASQIDNQSVPLTYNGNNVTFGDDYYLIPQALTKAIGGSLSDENIAVSWDEANNTWDATSLQAWEDQYFFTSGNALEVLIQVKEAGENGKAIAPVIQGKYVAQTGDFDASKVYYTKVSSASDPSEYTYEKADITAFATGVTYYCFESFGMPQGYMWVYVPLDTDWFPGKRYIYTLNFAADAYGYVSPDQADGGTPDPMDPTPDDPNDDEEIPDPTKPVVESEVPLTFQVTVIDWDTENVSITDL